MDENDEFQIFLNEVSDHYAGVTVLVLRMLLYGILDIGDLNQSALDLFNQLHAFEFIQSTDVRLLMDIAEVTMLAAAKRRITQYTRTIRSSDTADTRARLTEYRKALFKALKNVGKQELGKVTAFYKLSAFNYNNIWDAVNHIEQNGRLNTQKKVKTFANLLNNVAKTILEETPYEPTVIKPITSGPKLTPATSPPASIRTRTKSLASTPIPISTPPSTGHWWKLLMLGIGIIAVSVFLIIQYDETVEILGDIGAVIGCFVSLFSLHKEVTEYLKKQKKD